MNILITGSKGFIGKNLLSRLSSNDKYNVMEYTREDSMEYLSECLSTADFVFHLAGINRPKDESEFTTGNVHFTEELLNLLRVHNNHCPVLITSSIQVANDNPYGQSKKMAEEALISHQGKMNSRVYIYRLHNVFGKWSKPNYNSVVATFCYNIANGLDVNIDDSNKKIEFVYIDDVINDFINVMENDTYQAESIYEVKKRYNISLGDLANTIKSFAELRTNFFAPTVTDEFTKKLYSTYLSYLPTNGFDYPLKMNVDNRGSFTEILKVMNGGQVSVNVSKPSIVKGNHWHNTKVEKFLVVSGNGVIRLRDYFSDQVYEYHVSGDELRVVDVPPGYTHSIVNVGDSDLITIIWANELFDPINPDTYYLEV